MPHGHAMGDVHVLHPLQRVKSYVPIPMSPSVALTVIHSTTTVYVIAGSNFFVPECKLLSLIYITPFPWYRGFHDTSANTSHAVVQTQHHLPDVDIIIPVTRKFFFQVFVILAKMSRLLVRKK